MSARSLAASTRSVAGGWAVDVLMHGSPMGDALGRGDSWAVVVDPAAVASVVAAPAVVGAVARTIETLAASRAAIRHLDPRPVSGRFIECCSSCSIAKSLNDGCREPRYGGARELC